MIELNNKRHDLCCGCGACAHICTYKAITMKRDYNGFVYPIIDQSKCVECGLCLKVCDFKVFKPTEKKPECYAARHIDSSEVMTSRSGGFFMSVCEYVTEESGVVFGCKLDDQLNVIHTYEETYEGCKKFKGSKYVQSELGETYSACEKFLLEGRKVLFSGTGCQVHGLISYLTCKKIPLENLITIDLVCHGAPSPGVWKSYIQALEKYRDIVIDFVDFRNKSINGWADHIEKYTTANGETLYSKQWTNVFYRNILFREACYNCKYATTERKSDFTIADYWGIGQNAPQFDDNLGCSLIMIHTDKGHQIFQAVKPKLHSIQTQLQTSMQPQMSRPIWRGWDYSLFWKIYKKNSTKAINYWFFPTRFVDFLWFIERVLKSLLKFTINFVRKHMKLIFKETK